MHNENIARREGWGEGWNDAKYKMLFILRDKLDEARSGQNIAAWNHDDETRLALKRVEDVLLDIAKKMEMDIL